MRMKRYSLPGTSAPGYDALVESVYDQPAPSSADQPLPMSSRRRNKAVNGFRPAGSGRDRETVVFLERISKDSLSRPDELRRWEQRDTVLETANHGRQVKELEEKVAPGRLNFTSESEANRLSPLTQAGAEDGIAAMVPVREKLSHLLESRAGRDDSSSLTPLEEEDVIVDNIDEAEQKKPRLPMTNFVVAKQAASQLPREEEDVIVDDVNETDHKKSGQPMRSSVRTESLFPRLPVDDANMSVDHIDETEQRKSGHPVVEKASAYRPREKEDVIVDDVDETQYGTFGPREVNSVIAEKPFSQPPVEEEDVIVDTMGEMEQQKLGKPVTNFTAEGLLASAASHSFRDEKNITTGYATKSVLIKKPIEQRRFYTEPIASRKTIKKTPQSYAASISEKLSSFLQKESGVVHGPSFLSDKLATNFAEADATDVLETPVLDSVPTLMTDKMPTASDSVTTVTSSEVSPLKALESETTDTRYLTNSGVATGRPRKESEVPTLQQEERHAPVKNSVAPAFDSRENNLLDFQSEDYVDGSNLSADEERIKQFQNHYQEWLYVVLEHMYGTHWDSENPAIRETGECSEKRLKNRGCALLVPACKKYTTPPGGWSCEMSLWRACSCSVPYKSFLKYLIPPASECYGEVLHPSDVLRLIDAHVSSDPLVDTSSQVLIPTGYCGWSGFFVFYIIMVATLIIAFIGVLHRFARRALKGKSFASLPRVKRGRQITTTPTVAEDISPSSVMTSETQPLVTNRYAARRMPV